MRDAHWKITDLPWDQFDPHKLDPEILKMVKAASLVEYGGNTYARYLCNVFPDDAVFQQAAKDWAREEVLHGEALGHYAERADPNFSLQSAFNRYNAGYGFNVEAAKSSRGSRSGELIARCIIESGTSSYYTAISDAAGEPVLKAMCRRIAADEFRHYKLFYTHLRRYLIREKLSRIERLLIGLRRIRETEDDELAFAYHAANAPPDAVYRRAAASRAYMARAYSFYRPEHVDRVVSMVFKVCGLRPHTIWHGLARRAAWHAVSRKGRGANPAGI